jgi:deoxyhypusine synthase
VTWGKVDKDAYTSTCVSLQADYTMVMPFLVKALFAKHPTAKGYLRAKDGYRLMDRREELVRSLLDELAGMEKGLRSGLDYDLAASPRETNAARRRRKKAPVR